MDSVVGATGPSELTWVGVTRRTLAGGQLWVEMAVNDLTEHWPS